MNIRLINIPRLYRYTFPPYGLGVINSYLKKLGLDSDIFDLDIVIKDQNSKKTLSSIDLEYIKKNIWNFPDFLKEESHDQYLNEQFDKMVSLLKIRDNEILAFHVPHKEIYLSLFLAKKIKQAKTCSIILGGLEIKRKSHEHIGQLTRELNIDYVDHFVTGDPYSFFDKLSSNEIRIFNKQPEISDHEKKDPDLDWQLPEFNKEHLDLYRPRPDRLKYFFGEMNQELIDRLGGLKGAKRPLVMPYKFQFGCNNRCAYCGFGKEPQKLPVDRVMSDIQYLKKKYNSSNFYFLNTNIATEKRYTENLIQRLQSEHDIQWSDTANLNMVNPKMIENFSKSGCIEIFMGFATASQKLHNYVGRGPNNNHLEHFSKCFKATDDNGIWMVTDLICGLPYERNKDIIQTRNFLLRNKKYINGILTNTFIMMKNSPFAIHPKKYGLKLYQKNYSVNDIANGQDITVSNFGGINFDEIYGLKWEKKSRQIANSAKFFKELIREKFPNQFYSWYPIFLLYNNFESKKEIKKFLAN